MLYILFLFVVWLLYVGANTAFAAINAAIRAKRLKTGNPKQINHPIWAFYYCALCAPMWWVFKDWYFIGSILLLHLSVFPFSYNLDIGQPPFALSKTTSALSDRLMVKIGLKSTEVVNFLALLASVILLVISFFQKH